MHADAAPPSGHAGRPDDAPQTMPMMGAEIREDCTFPDHKLPERGVSFPLTLYRRCALAGAVSLFSSMIFAIYASSRGRHADMILGEVLAF